MKEAVSRVAVFLGYAFHSSTIPPLKSIRLGSAVELDIGAPDPIPLIDRKSYQREFVQWSIGQGLTEIDQSYHRYVASAISTIQRVIEFRKNHVLPKTVKPILKNTWSTHEEFYDVYGSASSGHDAEARHLRSLGNARNCLAHDSGIVTQRRIADGHDTMQVSWPGRDMFMTDLKGNRRMLPRDRGYRGTSKDDGSTISIEDVVRHRSYISGDSIIFSQTDLAEVLFFYQILAMKVGAELHRLVHEQL